MRPEQKLKEIQAEIAPVMEFHGEVGGCVFRLWYGDKYIIAKGRTLGGTVFMIQKGLAYFLYGGGRTRESKDGIRSAVGVFGEGHKEGQGKSTFYFQFFEHYQKNTHKFQHLAWHIDLILASDNGYQLLKREQIELEAAMRDKKCLSSNVQAYIPAFRKETGMYGGWIKKAHVMNFKKYLKRPLPVGVSRS